MVRPRPFGSGRVPEAEQQNHAHPAGDNEPDDAGKHPVAVGLPANAHVRVSVAVAVCRDGDHDNAFPKGYAASCSSTGGLVVLSYAPTIHQPIASHSRQTGDHGPITRSVHDARAGAGARFSVAHQGTATGVCYFPQIRGTTLDGVTYRCGDFADGELSRTVNTKARNKVVVDAYREHATGRRAIAFTVDVAHAHDLCKAFTDDGIRAASVTGTTPRDERRQILADFASGKIDVVTNCAVLTEGFDDPGVSCLLMARPTASRPLYTQCVGRGLRQAPGKSDCLILDITDNSERHKLVTVLDLFGKPQSRNAAGDVMDYMDAEQSRAEQLRLVETSHPLTWSLRSVCPWPELPSLKGYVPSASWHWAPASEKQADYLRRFGLDIGRKLTKGEASHLIDRARDYEAAFPSPATSKQVWRLKREGIWREGITKCEASKLIGQLYAA